MAPILQAAVIQCESSDAGLLPLTVAHDRPLPPLPTPYHVLIQVKAVGLNPTDHKMVTHFPMPNTTVGCDFCGVVVESGPSSIHPLGTRVCGADFPYRKDNPYNGAFAQHVVADSRHLLIVPEGMSDLQGAALGGIGWGTAALAMADSEALGLEGLPSSPCEKDVPVVVYGGGTATGIMAVQMLKLAGYKPIAVCSPASSPLLLSLGASGTASYLSPTCAADIKTLADGKPIKHVLDCITDAESVAVCFSILARTGGRLACLEAVPDTWITRRAIKLKVVMGFEGMGVDVELGHEVYSRKANWKLHKVAENWAKELQGALDAGALRTMKVREVQGGLGGVIKGLEMLKNGEVRGEKLVVSIPGSGQASST